MNTTTTLLALSPTLLPNFSPCSSSSSSSFFTLSLNPKTKPNLKSKPIKCVRNSGGAFNSNSPHCKPSIQNPCAMTSSCLMEAPAPCFTERPPPPPQVVAEKVKRLVLEFKALPEPIDRVKRLLHYAVNLPPCSELVMAPKNRVPGCTTQVWVEAEVDKLGRMRFRADSDSEISKGFCSCLIWMLDGAEPREVLEIRGKDLEDVNVGLYGKANSRVNTWHNVLLAMQRKTRDLVSAAERSERPSAFSGCE